MATKQPLPGIPAPQLPQWAGANDTKLNSLPQTFLNKRKARPLKADGGWLGDLGPQTDPTLRGPALGPASSIGADAITNPGLSAPPSTIAPDQIASPSGSASGSINWQGISDGLNKAAPFASNIANSFRRVPQPIRSQPISAVTLSRVNNSNERANLDEQTRGMDLAANRGLSANTAAAVRAGNLSTRLRAYGDSYARENNANADISNRQAEINSGIEEKNIGLTNEYNQELVGSKIAQQRQDAANLSNASDKYVQIQNANAQRALDQQKFKDASRLINTGVSKRYQDFLEGRLGEVGKIKAAQDGKVSTEQDNDRDEDDDDKKYGGKLKMAKGGRMNTTNQSNLKRLRKAYY